MTENEVRAAEAGELSDDRAPLHPMRVYGELSRVLDRDAIVIGDGGDFVSYAGRLLDSFEPGCWLDPGPLGCLGSGFGYALAAKLARPDRQVVLLLGDGAFGFAGMELDTLARHGVNVLAVIGNNGIWALEKHPMEALYGYSGAAALPPATRYDAVAEALGCDGELVEAPAELRPALERGLASGKPTLVNVLTDPSIAYPRRSNLARPRSAARFRDCNTTRIRKPPAFSAGGFRSRFGPIGTGRGTGQEGPVRGACEGGG